MNNINFIQSVQCAHAHAFTAKLQRTEMQCIYNLAALLFAGILWSCRKSLLSGKLVDWRYDRRWLMKLWIEYRQLVEQVTVRKWAESAKGLDSCMATHTFRSNEYVAAQRFSIRQSQVTCWRASACFCMERAAQNSGRSRVGPYIDAMIHEHLLQGRVIHFLIHLARCACWSYSYTIAIP